MEKRFTTACTAITAIKPFLRRVAVPAVVQTE
jgi:hypothetical protein